MSFFVLLFIGVIAFSILKAILSPGRSRPAGRYRPSGHGSGPRQSGGWDSDWPGGAPTTQTGWSSGIAAPEAGWLSDNAYNSDDGRRESAEDSYSGYNSDSGGYSDSGGGYSDSGSSYSDSGSSDSGGSYSSE